MMHWCVMVGKGLIMQICIFLPGLGLGLGLGLELGGTEWKKRIQDDHWSYKNTTTFYECL